MEHCPGCNVPGSAWCYLGSLGRCAWLAAPHWAAHNAARSPRGPGPAEPSAPPPPEPAPAAEIFLSAWPEGCEFLGPVLRPHGGCRSCELRVCRAGKGNPPGTIRLMDCLACEHYRPPP